MSIFSTKTRINIVGLRGVIGDLGRFQKGLTLENCSNILDKTFTYKKPNVVVIKINSPGGSPVQSELIYDRIKTLSNKNKVKVVGLNQVSDCKTKTLFYQYITLEKLFLTIQEKVDALYKAL